MEENSNSQEDRPSSNNEHSAGANNSTQNNEKIKRHRRGKLDTANERTFKCPDCEKSYLSDPALVVHRKTKHGYVGEGEKRARGRPKASEEQEISYKKAQEYYNNFFNNENRKKTGQEQFDIDFIKKKFINIYNDLKEKNIESLKGLQNVEHYPFYNLVVNLWDIKDPILAKESKTENTRKEGGNNEKKCSNPPMEQVFYLYLKDLADKTNNNYFEFSLKFIILYREFINNFKKSVMNKDKSTSNVKEDNYSEIYCAEEIPESCNDFFLDFLQPRGYNDKEYISLAQYFCFWLYDKKYTQSYLTLMN